ncbi:LytTR family transcriptional regulator DNA-binding domain-containing protein [Solibacillus merdavium]|nr:LytTR family transcriptional regulator DNA-binding domain-containing protein [Solibacillus merdavium]
MKLTIEVIEEFGEVLLPAVELFAEKPLVNIYTDVTKMNLLKQQLLKMPKVYVHAHEEGHYERLTVEETFQFYLKLHNMDDSVETLMKAFGLEQFKKIRVNELTSGERQVLSFLKAYVQRKEAIILIEPFQNLQQVERKVLMHLIIQIQLAGKKVVLLSNNLEHLINSEGEILRLDEEGLHKMDVKEEQQEQGQGSIETIQLKIEKIPTKKNEKIILFNPPEIDYIESVEGEVFVYVAGEAYPCTLTLSELEKRLHHFGFFRCHRSYIVNLQKVREIISWTRNSYSLSLQGTGKLEVPLSRTKLSELKEIVGI